LEKLLLLAVVVGQRVLVPEETVVLAAEDHGQEVILQGEQLREILLLDMDMETMVVSQQESTTEELAEEVLEASEQTEESTVE
jgi:hypothetical protein